MSTLVLAELDGQQLAPSLGAVVAAAHGLGEPVVALVAGGPGSEQAAQAAAALHGVSHVMLAEGEAHAHGLAEPLADQVMVAMKEGGHRALVAAASSQGKNVLPRVAALLDVGMVSDVTAVLAPDTFERPIYAGNVVATVQTTDAIRVLTVRPTSFEAPGLARADGPAPIVRVVCVASSAQSRFVSEDKAISDRPELASAKVVVSGGRGLGSAEQYQALLMPLADKLGAALGASRAAVDAGYAPNDCQVGQTGKVVAPQLYIAVGMSGAIQHLAGMKGSKVIVAINKDPDAPIFQVADYGLVADLFEAVPELTRQLP
jgi:electron transfer flavoprotein alpha subunit